MKEVKIKECDICGKQFKIYKVGSHNRITGWEKDEGVEFHDHNALCNKCLNELWFLVEEEIKRKRAISSIVEI